MNKQFQEAKQIINDSDSLLIGAGSGLSTAAGFKYDGEVFDAYFSYMREKYGANDMYSAGFAPFEDEEEFWGYWAVFIYLERYSTGALPLYKRLTNFLKDKDYFVITTNVDHQFQKSGINKHKLFYTQGDYGLFQSTDPRNQKTYDNGAWIEQAVKNIDPMTHKIPKSLIPICQDDGQKMITNLRCDDNFVEDDGWHLAANRYQVFLDKHKNSNITFLELGVGYNTPGIIKYPFMSFTAQNKKSHYISVGLSDGVVPAKIQNRSLLIKADLSDFIDFLIK